MNALGFGQMRWIPAVNDLLPYFQLLRRVSSILISSHRSNNRRDSLHTLKHYPAACSAHNNISQSNNWLVHTMQTRYLSKLMIHFVLLCHFLTASMSDVQQIEHHSLSARIFDYKVRLLQQTTLITLHQWIRIIGLKVSTILKSVKNSKRVQSLRGRFFCFYLGECSMFVAVDSVKYLLVLVLNMDCVVWFDFGFLRIQHDMDIGTANDHLYYPTLLKLCSMDSPPFYSSNHFSLFTMFCSIQGTIHRFSLLLLMFQRHAIRTFIDVYNKNIVSDAVLR